MPKSGKLSEKHQVYLLLNYVNYTSQQSVKILSTPSLPKEKAFLKDTAKNMTSSDVFKVLFPFRYRMGSNKDGQQ